MAGRDLSKMNSLFGPGGCCDACGHPNWDLIGVGILCYHCRQGIFMHRRFWRYYFGGEEFLCAVPRDDVEADAVHAEWREIAASRVDRRYTISVPLLDALHTIGEHRWDAYASPSAYGAAEQRPGHRSSLASAMA